MAITRMFGQVLRWVLSGACVACDKKISDLVPGCVDCDRALQSESVDASAETTG